MNILKNFEAIFIVAVALSFSAAAIAQPPAPRAAKAPTVANSANNSKVITVVVPGKRLSKAEKARLAAL